MSSPTGDIAERAIIDRILADARTQAGQTVAQAEADAQRLLAEAAGEAEAAAAAIVTAAEREAAQIEAKAAALARMEARRAGLQALEDAIEGLVTEVGRMALNLRADVPQYRRVLVSLVVECLRTVDAPGTTLTFGVADKPLIEDGVVREAQQALGDGASECGVQVQYVDRDLGGGCVAASPCGRIRLDNTLPRRLAESRTRLRTLLAKELGGSGG